MSAVQVHKQGDTFVQYWQMTEAGEPVDLSDFTIRCQLRKRNGDLVHVFGVVITNPTGGQFEIRASLTSEWPLEPLEYDIEFEDSEGNIASSDTVRLEVLKDVSRAAG